MLLGSAKLVLHVSGIEEMLEGNAVFISTVIRWTDTAVHLCPLKLFEEQHSPFLQLLSSLFFTWEEMLLLGEEYV